MTDEKILALTPHYALQQKYVLITGAAGGIGSALARAFAAQGAHLLLLDWNADKLQLLADELSLVSSASPLVCDLTSDKAVADLAKHLQTQGVWLDVLINNAGVEYPTPLLDDTDGASNDNSNVIARWANLLDNNVVSIARLIRGLLPLMRSGTSIINQSSIWGKTGVADFSAYVASKHAVIGLTRSLAFELAPRGIRVNAVCPGWIRTDAAMRSLNTMAETQGCESAVVEAQLLSNQAIKKMLEPAAITGIYLFLASVDAAPITGQSMVVSNGEVMS
jgi:NAD(P)-dependent dehydrogenase (short-subunit alcohol dehydrogenase family)